ncbi:amidase [Paraburkholderia sp. J67]|uniref:amidase n=1 Tax=Paraburkholderia sp. J67 TaxID=2805435 RepID=UPI002ABDE251|nr:amidase [Paraburkholderia sp. J67]
MSALLQQLSIGGNGPASPTIVIKDSIDIAGYRTSGASRALADVAPAQHHAEVVERLIGRGWKIVGKANMHELAFGMTGMNEYTGTPVNPQDASRIPGGSSSGSAVAVGAGMADAALGTDTGGSIRGPAACCGVIGLKPTFGRVSRIGVAPAQSTLDCVGPFARDMRTIALAMSAISEGFNVLVAQNGAPAARVGIVRADARRDISEAVEAAVRKAELAMTSLELAGLADAFTAGLSIINRETSRAFGHLVETGHLQPDLEARLRAAANTSDEDVARAEQVRRRFTQNVDEALKDLDVLVMPTLPDFPITLEQARNGTSVIAMSSLIRPFNLSGHPALSLPVAVPGTTLKAGLQIVGRHGADELVCAVASRIEAALAA